MADITLSTGREIEFDLSKISLREYRSLFGTKLPTSEEDELITRVAGLTLDEYQDLPMPDYKRIIKGLVKKVREPLADPN